MKEEKIQYYEGVYVDEFPIGPYFRDKFNRIPSNLRYDYTFNYHKLIDYLTQSQYLELVATYELKGDKGTKKCRNNTNICVKTTPRIYSKSRKCKRRKKNVGLLYITPHKLLLGL